MKLKNTNLKGIIPDLKHVLNLIDKYGLIFVYVYFINIKTIQISFETKIEQEKSLEKKVLKLGKA